MTTTLSTTCFARGATINFSTQFFDNAGNPTQPSSATINIVSPGIPPSEAQTTAIAMTPPSGSATNWTAAWDSRGSGSGLVFWSIRSGNPSTPYAVEDGSFELSANSANLVTF